MIFFCVEASEAPPNPRVKMPPDPIGHPMGIEFFTSKPLNARSTYG